MKRTLYALAGLSLLLSSCGQPGSQPKPAPDQAADSTRAAPVTLQYGQTSAGVIAGQARDFDYYIFDAAAGDQLRIDVKAPAGSTLDPYVRLYLNDGWVLLEKDDDGQYNPSDGSVDSQILFNVDKDGRYAVEVSSFKLVNDPTAADNNPKNLYTVTLSKR
ncbi:MAG: PPC domain-containing protein [Deinococcus sp.]|nr:PPC domain-containing protein [Deinococcus sp.]